MLPTFKFQIVTGSVDETKRLGQKIGSFVNARTIIALTGDLGSGKTSFAQGLARGLSVPDNYYITSPTYTLINEYPGRYELFHVDLYRLGDPIDFVDVGLYDILDTNGVVIIEWADRLPQDLLSEYIDIKFEIDNWESRNIHLAAYGLEGVNLLKRLEKVY